MAISAADAIKHLDDVLDECEEMRFRIGVPNESPATTTLVFRMKQALLRLAPPGSPYAEAISSQQEFELEHNQWHRLYAAVQGLRSDYVGGYLTNYSELVRQSVYGDFLSMARMLLEENDALRLPAAVLAGGVLEEHLRKLSTKFGNAVTFTDNKNRVVAKKAARLNDELKPLGAYGVVEGSGKTIHKQVNAWLAIRNSAAHNKLDEFDTNQTEQLIDGVEFFVARHPA